MVLYPLPPFVCFATCSCSLPPPIREPPDERVGVTPPTCRVTFGAGFITFNNYFNLPTTQYNVLVTIALAKINNRLLLLTILKLLLLMILQILIILMILLLLLLLLFLQLLLLLRKILLLLLRKIIYLVL
jgi:hypothetical protein